ncbi:hypothetical protein ACH5RR_022315 [Cinchona calisaya]|uniref:Protein kinase domain-containing protein n=1 Tax=Cinchona calisaya TaxID=153742 RepID=A0ABD2Z7G7_9GENT
MVSFLDHVRKIQSSRKRRKEETPSKLFLQNGSLLLEKLIAASNGKYDVPIQSFTAKELMGATNNFVDNFHTGRFSNICRGSWQDRPILVKKFIGYTVVVPSDTVYDTLSGVVNDIATSAQMSHHKNVAKLLGCCLEFNHPALVYEYSGDEHLLDALLNSNSNRLLSWKSRLKIAADIANVVLYLHTAFHTPIIYRILNPRNIIVDKYDVAKIFDFSFSISLPPGKMQIHDDVIGITGYFDYDYCISGLVSQKTDVFCFGVFLLVLLTGQGALCTDQEGDQIHIVEYVKDCISRNEMNEIVDGRISEREEIVLNPQQLSVFIDLALRCSQDWGKDRPNMIDVAKELLEIRRQW